PSTARFFTTVPSYTPQLPPTSTSSSMTTGIAPTGSSTPPICAAAEMWHFLPICAQLPTSTCESTSVPSPTYAPTLMYIGGMHVTLLPTKQPSRMLDPPGTIRTPDSAVNFFTGYVALSKKGCRDASIDISTITPIRKPIKIPFFTQELTRHPVADDGSGSAARTTPEFKPSLNSWNRRRCCPV